MIGILYSEGNEANSILLWIEKFPKNLCFACNSILQILNKNESNNCQTTFKLWFLWQIFHNMRSDWKIRKIRFFQNLFSTSKIKPWYINIFSQNEVSVPVWIFFIRILKKNRIFVVRLKDSPSSLRSVFISRSLSHTPIRKTSPSVFLSHTLSHSLSDMCSVHDAAYIFHVFKLRPPQF